MRRWLIPCVAALVAAAPALAQTGTPPSSDSSASRMQPDKSGAAPKGDVGQGAEAKKTNPNGAATSSARSGGAGLSQDRSLGSSKPADDSAEAYKKDFQKK